MDKPGQNRRDVPAIGGHRHARTTGNWDFRGLCGRQHLVGGSCLSMGKENSPSSLGAAHRGAHLAVSSVGAGKFGCDLTSVGERLLLALADA